MISHVTCLTEVVGLSEHVALDEARLGEDVPLDGRFALFIVVLVVLFLLRLLLPVWLQQLQTAHEHVSA